jgi:hypothetical protein
MGIRISKHAEERAAERGLAPYELRNMARQLANRPDGEYSAPRGRTVVLRNSTITTILLPGMRGDSRM